MFHCMLSFVWNHGGVVIGGFTQILLEHVNRI